MNVTQDLFRHSYVLFQDSPNRLVQDSLVIQFQRRDDKSLLVNLRVVAGIAAGHPSSDVRLVPDATTPTEQGFVDEYGLKQEDVGQMAAALVGVVVGEDILGVDIVAKSVHNSLQRRRH